MIASIRALREGHRSSLLAYLGLPLVLALLAVAFIGRGLVSGATYSQTILADGPSIYWRLGEASGSTAADTSGHGNTGAYSASGVTYGVAGAPLGDSDTAVSLSGGGNVIENGTGGVPVGNAARTTEAWVKT